MHGIWGTDWGWRTAEVFEAGLDKIVKLHHEWVSPEWIEHQLEVDRAISRAGVPCPKVFGSIEQDGRIGIIYERVYGRTLRNVMESRR